MTTRIGVGISRNIHTPEAAAQAAQQAKLALKNTPADLLIIFSTVHHDPQVIAQAAQEYFPHAKIIGCSTAGIIHAQGIETLGLGFMAIASDEVKFGVGAATNITQDNLRLAGNEMAKNMILDFGNQGRSVCLFFVDGNISDSSALLKGVQEVLGTVFPIVGAGSCDDFRFEKNFQIFKAQKYQMSACGFLMGAGPNVAISGRHGWRPLGKPRIVTSTRGNIIQTIDGKKAAGLYEEYFDESYKNLRVTQLGHMSILYPLGIFVEDSNHYLLRNAVDILEDGSIVCQGGVPEGAEVHIMIGNKDSCREAAYEAAQDAQRNLRGKKAQLVIIIDSMARLKLLGRGAFTEIARIRNVFGLDTPIFGMYANGEICPFESLERIKRPYLQNESIVVLAIS